MSFLFIILTLCLLILYLNLFGFYVKVITKKNIYVFLLISKLFNIYCMLFLSNICKFIKFLLFLLIVNVKFKLKVYF